MSSLRPGAPIVLALGGNALLRRGEPLEARSQAEAVRRAAGHIARLALAQRLVVAHGNGPQVGLLALQNDAFPDVRPYPLDVLGAQTEGMVGYLLEQEIDNRLPQERSVATLLTRVEVDPDDPAFGQPTKPIGPVYDTARGEALARERGWRMAPDGTGLRRVVASPAPLRFVDLAPIRTLLDRDAVVICAGGGGIPVAATGEGHEKRGVEAVIDKDLAAGLLARQLDADMLVIATDVPAVCLDWGTPTQRAIRAAHPQALERVRFAAGSMGPKVLAACQFALQTGRRAVIGSLEEADALIAGRAGTLVSTAIDGLQF